VTTTTTILEINKKCNDDNKVYTLVQTQ